MSSVGASTVASGGGAGASCTFSKAFIEKYGNMTPQAFVNFIEAKISEQIGSSAKGYVEITIPDKVLYASNCAECFAGLRSALIALDLKEHHHMTPRTFFIGKKITDPDHRCIMGRCEGCPKILISFEIPNQCNLFAIYL